MLDIGAVRIGATIEGGRVLEATVQCVRPRAMAAAFARHAPADIPSLARRIFALCGASQSIAAATALCMAGAAVEAPDPAAALRQLAAERLAEHLRATFIFWHAAVPPTPVEAASIARALRVVRGDAGRDGLLAGALDAAGFLGTPRAGSWTSRLLAEAGRVDAAPVALDPLSAADDAAVLAALDREGDAFAAAPSLPKRRPESGATARRGGETSAAARLQARFAEIEASACHLWGTARLDPADWLTAQTLELGTGFCAVETPRGRLHHLVRLAPDGAIARYLILAPTEWNFGATGPFATALRSLRATDDAALRPAIERLVSLYDPCVTTEIELHRQGGSATK